MKAITLSVTALMLLGTLTVGMADDISVDEQITAIQEAPAQERIKLMNQFKTHLATMNESEREEAITQLRTQTKTQTQARLQEKSAEGEANTEATMAKTRTMTQERSRVNEMQQTQEMQQQQQMQQQQLQQQAQQQMQQVGTQITDTMPTQSGNGH